MALLGGGGTVTISVGSEAFAVLEHMGFVLVARQVFHDHRYVFSAPLVIPVNVFSLTCTPFYADYLPFIMPWCLLSCVGP